MRRKHRRHGLHGHSLYQIHCGMMNRCYNAKNPRYGSYGGRGIKVCVKWHRVENFIREVGPRPSKKHSLDRINNNGNYSPKNCRWATPKTQSNNTSKNILIKLNGRKMTIAQWARDSGIKNPTLHRRYYIGGTKELLRPTKNRIITWKGESLRLHQWVKKTGIARRTITKRLDKLGWSIGDALSIKTS